jgi:hypothetical protein
VTAQEAILAIQKIMDGTEWNSGTADQIAEVLREAGYEVGDIDHDHAGDDEPGPTDDDLYDTSGEAHRPQINDAGERMY